MTEDIEKLLAYGQIGLETGQYEQAREDFEQALALDASNFEAKKALYQIDRLLERRRASFEPVEIHPTEPIGKKARHWARSVVVWIRDKFRQSQEWITESVQRIRERREEQAKQEQERIEKRAKEIEEVKQAWAEERVRRGGVPLQLGQCPECGRIDSYRKKDDSGCIAAGILGVVVLGGVLMVLTMGSMEVCVGSGILIFLLLLVNLLLPDNFHCRFCGAMWRS